MKEFTLFILFSLFSSPAWAGISFVNDAAANGGIATGAGNPITASMNMTTGNLIYVALATPYNGTDCSFGGTAPTVIDSASNTYTFIATTNVQYTCVSTYYAANITGGSNTISVYIASSGAYVTFVALEFSGLNPTSPLDSSSVVASGLETSGTITSPAFSTATANEVVIAAVADYYNGAPYTAGTTNSVNMSIPSNGEFTGAGGGNPNDLTVEYIIESSTLSSVTSSMSLGGSVYSSMAVAAFQAASTAATSDPLQLGGD